MMHHRTKRKTSEDILLEETGGNVPQGVRSPTTRKSNFLRCIVSASLLLNVMVVFLLTRNYFGPFGSALESDSIESQELVAREELLSSVVALETVMKEHRAEVSREIQRLMLRVGELQAAEKHNQNPFHSYSTTVGQYIEVIENGRWTMIEGIGYRVPPVSSALLCRFSLHGHCHIQPYGKAKVRIAVTIDGKPQGFMGNDFGHGTMYHHTDWATCEARAAIIVPAKAAPRIGGALYREAWGPNSDGAASIHGAVLEANCLDAKSVSSSGVLVYSDESSS